MSLLQLAHEERLAHRPRSINSCYAGPVNPTYGQLPGWVADLTRSTYPTYAQGR
jgi:FAD/FMN-containing dehydrogenase